MIININDLLMKIVEMKASDLHITVGIPPVIRKDGVLRHFGDTPLRPEDTERLTSQILDSEQKRIIKEVGELDLSYHLPGVSRFRVNAYKQRGSYSLAIRVVNMKVPSLDELGFPECVKNLAMKTRGLILVTGPTGSGKSTTLASMIDHINKNRNAHILTLEDPIEYLHKHNKSIVNQREIGTDSMSFKNALRAALREDPDVILVGEMRDIETISIAVTAAETGHLVMSTLHTVSADQTIDRIIDAFPPSQQSQIRIQLAGVLEGIIAQQLIPCSAGGGRIAALEILIANNAIKNLIREGRTHQIRTAMQTGTKIGMQTMDFALSELLRKGMITREIALEAAHDPEMLRRHMVLV